MILEVVRYNHDKKTTQGILLVNTSFECFTLEDEHRCEKVHGKTRIPSGYYKVKMRKELTPLTQKYREKYDWFTYHIQLMDVPGFEWVYIHIGNRHIDTEGCLLVGDTPQADPDDEESYVWHSERAFIRLYKIISGALNAGEEVTIQIREI